MRASLSLLTSFAILACGSDDPFTSGPAHASVTGSALNSVGTPLPGASIRITCEQGVSARTIVADSLGHYLANLVTGSDPFEGSGGALHCVFREPASGTARVQLDTLLGFSRGPVLVPLQFVDLREP